MKKLIKLFMTTIVFAMAVACGEINQVDYVAPLNITFEGVNETNIVQVAKGETSYTVKVNIQSANKIRSLTLYDVDIKTGSTLGTGEATIFDPVVESYSFDLTVDDLVTDKAVMVFVEDESLNSFSRKLYVKITADVNISNLIVLESADAFYGTYYASWLYGRTYLGREVSQYINEVDFSLGNVAINGTDTVAALVSPDRRQELGLPFVANLKSTKFELTALTREEFDAILPSDGSAIRALPAPTQSLLEAENGKVYLFENERNRGLILVLSYRARKETLQQQDGSWVKNQTYHELRILTKTLR